MTYPTTAMDARGTLDRVGFYAGGAAHIAYHIRRHSELATDITDLFGAIRGMDTA